MRLSENRRSVRPSFTLVELLVVFAIISVLVSLISAAVWKAMITASRVRARSEISQLTVALENFKAKYGFYLPSRIHLAEKLSMYNLNRQLDVDSIQILSQMFPRITDVNSSTWNTTGINWSGKRSGPPIDLGVLEGDQCLVFFLGGIPDNFSGSINCTGFSTNPTNPAAHIPSGGDTLPPFFEFDSSRLSKFRPGSSAQLPCYVYLDTYRGRPYAYFSSGKSRNDYNRYFSVEGHNSDCHSLSVWPYAESISTGLGNIAPARFLNPSSFQIITAGADGLFGSGTRITGVIGTGKIMVGTPAFPPNSAFYATTDPGYDDLSNFRDSILGSSN